ncbi:MAG TPA: dihydrofolate reductase [Bacteroidales bacterium]|nr:dihydrofolate reductase [Bacteroidales bacterium]
MISIIAALSDDNGIGRNNDLLWKIPDDLKRFKKLTTGNTVIMGKKTWESLPSKPLPGRKNIVITDIPGEQIEGAVTAFSIEDAVAKCEKNGQAFIIGGGSIYRQFMLIADQLNITHVHSKAPADIYFPEIDMNTWRITEKQEFQAQGSVPAYTYTIYERK